MHAVELHAQVGNAGTRALALFQLEQEPVAVVLDRAQFVELRIEPGGDDAAVAHQRRGRLLDRRLQHVGAARRRLQIVGQLDEPRVEALQHGRQQRRLAQAQLQRQQFARAHLAQRDARGDAFDVGATLDVFAQTLPGAAAQGCNRL